MFFTSLRLGVVHRLRAFGAALITCGLGMLLATSAQAQTPAAGTNIANQATVAYRDTAGVLQLSTSNAVTTLVLQVGAFTLTPASGISRTAGAGSTVYTAYVLTNTGNGTDTYTIDAKEVSTTDSRLFSKIEVYADDGSGRPANTTALCSNTDMSANCRVTRELASGANFKFVVAYSVPTTASTWTAPNTATVTVNQTLANGTAATRTDSVTLTTNAAFQVNKAIAPPNFTPSGVTWTAPTSGPTGATTTYTISYTNTGAATGNLYLSDALPSGMTYVAGSAYLSCSPNTALNDNAQTVLNGSDAALCNNQGVQYEFGSGVLQAIIPNVAPNTTGTLSYRVTINTNAAIGTSTTTNSVNFTAGGCSINTIAGCSTQTLSTANSAEYTVLATRRVAFNTQDTTPGTPVSSTDGATTARIMLGTSAIQTHTITNNGNVADTFVLKLDQSTYPTGTVFRWFSNLAATIPLQSSNSDGYVDTGVMAAGASKSIYLQITLPTDAAINPTANYNAVFVANALGAPTILDATNAATTEVGAGWVDLTTTATSSQSSVKGDFGPGPGTSAALTTAAIEAGNMVQIPLFIRNNESTNSITYTMAVSSNAAFPGSLPAGWTVVFSSTACSSITALTNNEATVANNTQRNIFACVTAPSNASTQNLPLFFRALAKTAGSAGYPASDILQVAVAVYSTSTYDLSLSSSGINGVLRGTAVDFSHVLVNNGQTTCGASSGGFIRVIASLPADRVAQGWSTTVYLDADNNGVFSTGDTVIDSSGTLRTGGLASRGSIKFLVRITAPGGANVNDTATVTVTVADVDSSGNVLNKPNGCGSITNSNEIKVLAGALSVAKTQATAAAVSGVCPVSSWPTTSAANVSVKPGDCVYYEIIASNLSATTVTNVVLGDTIPSHTTRSTAFTPTCTSVLMSGTAPSFAMADDGVTVTCTSGTNANAMSPLGSLTLRFVVQLKNN